jgi:hypothetical protein
MIISAPLPIRLDRQEKELNRIKIMSYYPQKDRINQDFRRLDAAEKEKYFCGRRENMLGKDNNKKSKVTQMNR